MQSTTDLLQRPAAQAQPVAAVRAKTTRLVYLDTIRVILICLVIALHTAITYGGNGGWPYHDPYQDEVTAISLTLFIGLIQAFSLGLYFFISGFFTPASYDRKGVWAFWKDRLVRLALPMVLYTWVFSRIGDYVAAVAGGEEKRSFIAYFTQTFFSSPNDGPTWFIFSLLVFTLGYTLWRLATRSAAPAQSEWLRGKAPGKKEILGFGLVIAALMFIIGLVSPVNNSIQALGVFNMMVIFFAQYILFYIAGIWAYRGGWLQRWDGGQLRFWAWLSLALAICLPVIFALALALGGSPEAFMGGLNWQSPLFMLWVNLFAVSISMTLILWLRDRKQPQARLMAYAGPNSYAVYLIHPIVLIPVAAAFGGVPLMPAVKFILVLPLVIVLCFLIAGGLRRLPGVKAVL